MDDIPEGKLFSDNLNPLPVGTHLQEFVVEKLIGIGGFGIVYQANDTLLGRSVAIKEYMPTTMAARLDGATVSVRSNAFTQDFESGKRSFINEARMLARFKHAALIEVFRFWEQNGTAYMATPFYEGQTLKEKLQAKNASVPDQNYILTILQPIFDALETMHAQQVFHRDISPDNIMVLPDGRPILLDLGAARKVLHEASQALTVMVKPGYAPIEQYSDDASIKQGPWTDVYALGAVIHFVITGKAPPPAASRLLKDSMPRLQDREVDGYTKEFLSAADAALRVRPEDRPQTVAEFRKLLLGQASVPPIEVPNLQATAVPSSLDESLSSPLASIDTEQTIVLPRTLTKTMASRAESTSAEPNKEQTEDQAEVQNKFQPEVSSKVAPKKSVFGYTAIIAVLISALVLGNWFFSKPSKQEISKVQSTPVEPSQAPTAVAVPTPAPISAPTPIQAPTEPVDQKPAASPSTPQPVSDQAIKPEKPALVKLNIKPWGEVFVDGTSKGISPPMKTISLPEGDYSIEIRNGDFVSYSSKLTLKAGGSTSVNHSFSEVTPAK